MDPLNQLPAETDAKWGDWFPTLLGRAGKGDC